MLSKFLFDIFVSDIYLYIKFLGLNLLAGFYLNMGKK